MHHGENFIITDKRQRTSTFSRARRNVDKVMTAVNHTGITATQVSSTILVSAFPSTITGIRWDLAFDQTAGTGASHMNWAIVLVKEGENADTMVRTDDTTFYQPESNCLVYGFQIIRNGTTTGHASGSTKTMRKVMIGDEILFLFAGSTTNHASVVGVIQLFQKM